MRYLKALMTMATLALGGSSQDESTVGAATGGHSSLPSAHAYVKGGRERLEWQLLSRYDGWVEVDVDVSDGSRPVADADVVVLSGNAFTARTRTDNKGKAHLVAYVLGRGTLRVLAQRVAVGADARDVPTGDASLGSSAKVLLQLDPQRGFDFPAVAPCSGPLEPVLQQLAPGACPGRSLVEMTYAAPQAVSRPRSNGNEGTINISMANRWVEVTVEGDPALRARQMTIVPYRWRSSELNGLLAPALGVAHDELGPLTFLCPLLGMTRTLRYGRSPGATLEVKSKGCVLDRTDEDEMKLTLF